MSGSGASRTRQKRTSRTPHRQLIQSLPSPTAYDDASLQAEIAAMNAAIEAEKYGWICDRPTCDGRPHQGWLHPHARQNQRPPDGRWLIWDLMAGRGFGKTRTGAETTRLWGENRPLQIAVVAKKDTLCREICFEGRSGLLNVIPPSLIPKGGYSKGAGSGSLSLRLTNGTRFIGFSAETPDNLRGWFFDAAWCDEFAAWPSRSAQDVLDQLLFCLRESEDPHIIVTSTPQSVKHQRRLVERAQKQPDGLVRVTRGHTDENRANLSDVALELIYGEFEGTRLGRQELGGELLEDVEGALWKKPWIDENAVYSIDRDDDTAIVIGQGEVPEMQKIVVAIDPAISESETSDETGIVAAGRGIDGEDYVLADRSGRVVGIKAAVRAWLLWVELDADELVYEDNQGDEWVRQVLTDAWKAMQKDPATGIPGGDPPIHSVHAKRGKRLRAEPVAARYEQGRVHHVRRMTTTGTIVNDLSKLEDQMTEWVPGEGDSPDRLDADVYAIARLRETEGRGATMSSPTQRDTASTARAAIVAGDPVDAANAADQVADEKDKADEQAGSLEDRLTRGPALDRNRVARPGGPVRIRRR